MNIKSYEKNKLVFVCGICGKENTANIKSLKIEFDHELNEFRNVAVDCQECKKEGKESTTFINVNLPEFDEMEIEVMEEIAPAEEVKARQEIRKLMWDHRPDLKKKNMNKEREKFMFDNKERIAEKKKGIQERKEARERAKQLANQ